VTDKPVRLGLFHHAGDYVVAALLLLSLGRAHVVAWPLCIGVCALVNAAATRGPLAAYRRIGLAAHRFVDIAVIASCLVGAVMVHDHGTDAAALVAIATVQAAVVWLSHLAR